jgi:hypothetical protein
MKIKRLLSADWRTQNLEELWRETVPLDSAQFGGSLHDFLEYCCLLKSVRRHFEADRLEHNFDGHSFFLRGGYFAFKFLNMTSSLALQATIFGGLNHGRHPKLELPCYISELRYKALFLARAGVELLIVDEVKSGTGMGTILNIVKSTMNTWPDWSKCDVRISFYAIRPGSTLEMTENLDSTVKKWEGKHETKGGLLTVDINHFAGHLPGYDSDRLCGVKQVSKNTDEFEAYEIYKSTGGTVTLSCEVSKKQVFEAFLDKGSLVEFLSSCTVAWTAPTASALHNNLHKKIELYGCTRCKELFRQAWA